MSILNEVLQWLVIIIFIGVVGNAFGPMKEVMLGNAKNIHEIIETLNKLTENTNAKKEK